MLGNDCNINIRTSDKITLFEENKEVPKYVRIRRPTRTTYIVSGKTM